MPHVYNYQYHVSSPNRSKEWFYFFWHRLFCDVIINILSHQVQITPVGWNIFDKTADCLEWCLETGGVGSDTMFFMFRRAGCWLTRTWTAPSPRTLTGRYPLCWRRWRWRLIFQYFDISDLTLLLSSTSGEQQVADWSLGRVPLSRVSGWAGRTWRREGTVWGGRTWPRPSEWRTRTWRGRWNDLSLGSLGVSEPVPRGPRLEEVLWRWVIWGTETGLETVGTGREGRRNVKSTNTSPDRVVSAVRPVIAPSRNTEQRIIEMTRLSSSENINFEQNI